MQYAHCTIAHTRISDRKGSTTYRSLSCPVPIGAPSPLPDDLLDSGQRLGGVLPGGPQPVPQRLGRLETTLALRDQHLPVRQATVLPSVAQLRHSLRQLRLSRRGGGCLSRHGGLVILGARFRLMQLSAQLALLGGCQLQLPQQPLLQQLPVVPQLPERSTELPSLSQQFPSHG